MFVERFSRRCSRGNRSAGEIHTLLQSRFNAAVRSSVPGARLETVPLEDGRRHEYLRWRVGEDKRDVTFYVMHTAKDAQQLYFDMRSTISVGSAVLDGVGDEAVLISPNGRLPAGAVQAGADRATGWCTHGTGRS